ncbi:Modification methylase HhaI [Variovorax sp. PBS-H4]|uniref:DNA cytosine methyltransferase n=1 Tax=Variovorax sp. PBS-H4 TaxID=434008 RepID=UPI001318903E|nr:DNA cytosine methyltransferase [Variovorax sp. PBS-H4]VTU38399.1 Modification methylase HhaI [Variovorax sp. PBS-H4]
MLGEGLRAGLGYLGLEACTVCYVEREAHAAAVLAARIEEGSLDPAPVWSDMLTFDARAWRGAVDCIAAGFPCQDLSVAGRRAGLDGERSGLFFRILDIADACGAWCLFLENVAGIATATASAVDEAEGDVYERAAARVVGELADRGWHAEWLTLSASDVGASHGRERWFCFAWRAVADAGRWGGQARYRVAGGDRRAPLALDVWCGHVGAPDRSRALAHADGAGQRNVGRVGRDRAWHEGPYVDQPRPLRVAYAGLTRLPHAQQQEPRGPGRGGEGRAATELRGAFAPGPADPRWPSILERWPEVAPALEPDFCGLADGMAFDMADSRAPRLKCVGNGVVATCAAVAFVELVRRARAT